MPALNRRWMKRRPSGCCWKKKNSRASEDAIRMLGDTERECLLLRASGLRYREIGEVLGIATSTVADIVDRAIKKLAEKCNV